MVGGMVGDVFGRVAVDPVPWVGEGLGVDFPYSRVEVRGGSFTSLDIQRMGQLLVQTELGTDLSRRCGTRGWVKSWWMRWWTT